MSRRSIFVLLALLPALMGFTPSGDTPAARGQSIVDEAERRGAGFGDMTATLTMTIRNARGAEAVRELDVKVLEVPQGSRSLTVVQSPRDVRGTALLTHSHDHEPDQQWVYFPAVKRVKRIAARARSGPFMGSEFTYEDMSGQASEKYRYKLMGEEKLATGAGEIDCWIVERIPKAGVQTAYSRHLSWVEKENLWLVKVKYFDQNNDHLKTLEAGDFELFEDKYWRAHQLTMTNVRTGGASILRWRDLQFGIGLNERDFDIEALKAAR